MGAILPLINLNAAKYEAYKSKRNHSDSDNFNEMHMSGPVFYNPATETIVK